MYTASHTNDFTRKPLPYDERRMAKWEPTTPQWSKPSKAVIKRIRSGTASRGNILTALHCSEADYHAMVPFVQHCMIHHGITAEMNLARVGNTERCKAVADDLVGDNTFRQIRAWLLAEGEESDFIYQLARSIVGSVHAACKRQFEGAATSPPEPVSVKSKPSPSKPVSIKSEPCSNTLREAIRIIDDTPPPSPRIKTKSGLSASTTPPRKNHIVELRLKSHREDKTYLVGIKQDLPEEAKFGKVTEAIQKKLGETSQFSISFLNDEGRTLIVEDDTSFNILLDRCNNRSTDLVLDVVETDSTRSVISQSPSGHYVMRSIETDGSQTKFTTNQPLPPNNTADQKSVTSKRRTLCRDKKEETHDMNDDDAEMKRRTKKRRFGDENKEADQYAMYDDLTTSDEPTSAEDASSDYQPPAKGKRGVRG